MPPCVYDEKFLTGTQFMFGTLLFMAGEDNDLKHPAQEQEEQCTTTVGFEFPRGLKNSATMLQVTFRAQDSPSGRRPKMDLPTNSISSSTGTATSSLPCALGQPLLPPIAGWLNLPHTLLLLAL
jgi:hypothetical protein